MNFKVGTVYKLTEFIENGEGEALRRNPIYNMVLYPKPEYDSLTWKQVYSKTCVFLCTKVDLVQKVAIMLTQATDGEIFETGAGLNNNAGYVEIL